MQELRGLRREALMHRRVRHQHVSHGGRRGQLLQTCIRVLVPAKDQRLQQARPAELALPLHTARLFGHDVGSLFQQVKQLLTQVCYTTHHEAPFCSERMGRFSPHHRRSSLLVSSPFSLNSAFLKLVRMGEDKPSPLLWTSLRSRWSKEVESMLRGSPLHFMWEQSGVPASALPNRCYNGTRYNNKEKGFL